jgi:hypothetical protein
MQCHVCCCCLLLLLLAAAAAAACACSGCVPVEGEALGEGQQEGRRGWRRSGTQEARSTKASSFLIGLQQRSIPAPLALVSNPAVWFQV